MIADPTPNPTLGYVQILITIVGMFVGPWLAVKFALSQFRSSQWWERRADMYTRIIENLSTLHHIVNEYLADVTGHHAMRPEDYGTFDKEYKDTVMILGKCAAGASFVVRQRVSDELTKLLAQLERDFPISVDRIKEDARALEVCITLVKHEGREHLSIRHDRWKHDKT